MKSISSNQSKRILTWSSAVVALAMNACSSTSADPPVSGTDAGGTMPLTEASADIGKMIASADPCTKAHTICLDMKVPDDLMGTPNSLQFDIYDSPGAPAHVPNGYAGFFNSPTLTAGQTVHFELTDSGLSGDFWLFGIMYMPGGGYGAPVIGTDYIQHSAPPALHLDGTPINLPPLVLSK